MWLSNFSFIRWYLFGTDLSRKQFPSQVFLFKYFLFYNPKQERKGLHSPWNLSCTDIICPLSSKKFCLLGHSEPSVLSKDSSSHLKGGNSSWRQGWPLSLQLDSFLHSSSSFSFSYTFTASQTHGREQQLLWGPSDFPPRMRGNAMAILRRCLGQTQSNVRVTPRSILYPFQYKWVSSVWLYHALVNRLQKTLGKDGLNGFLGFVRC